MIVPRTRITIALVPIEQIVITEHQRRYPDRVQHYVQHLSDPQHTDNYPGFVHLMPCADGVHYTILDGHHRYLASVICGRTHVLALVLIEPHQPGYDTVRVSFAEIPASVDVPCGTRARRS